MMPFHVLSIFRVSLILLMMLCPIIAALPGTARADKAERLIVDDFEKPGNKNSLGGDFGAFADPKGIGQCYLFFSQIKDGPQPLRSKYALYIQWDTSQPGAYGGYWSKLMHLDLEQVNYLTFAVKGSRGGEKFKVGLRGNVDATQETKVHIDKALPGGVTTQWQQVKIPLKWFKVIDSWSSVSVLSINFENAFGSQSGAMWIDDIAFKP